MENLPSPQTPEPGLLAIGYGTLVIAIFVGGLTIWTLLIPRLFRGEPLLPREPRRLVPWGMVDLLLAFALLVMVSLLAAVLFPIQPPAKPTGAAEIAESVIPPIEAKPLLERLTLADARKMIALDSGVKILVAILLIAGIGLRLRPSAADWGWTLAHWRTDLLIGGGTFLATFLPMIALQASLVHLLKYKYEHPLIELTTQTKDPLLFTLAVVAAALIAPLFEEFIFRGLLQGWLEKLCYGRASSEAIIVGGTETLPPCIDVENSVEPVTKFPLDPNPYASPQSSVSASHTAAIETSLPPAKFDWLAIIGSTLVFALLHYSHGPAWIPLLLFGAALGYVYQRTHRIWPGIVAHMLLNSVTMIGLWVQVFGGE